MDGKDCKTVIVAANEQGSVTFCTCGTVSVNYGNASLRLPVEEYLAFANLIDASFSELASRELLQNEPG